MKKFLLYLLRWQLSTPILALCLIWLGGLGEIPATIIANLIGAIIMYPVDRFIFSGGFVWKRGDKINTKWEKSTDKMEFLKKEYDQVNKQFVDKWIFKEDNGKENNNES